MEFENIIIRGKTIEDWKPVLYRIIFKADTPAGKKFDLFLLGAIIFSVIIVLLDSVSGIHESMGISLPILEWFFTILFTIEYITRIVVSKNKLRYILSFYGIVDLLSILPAYMSIFNSSYRALLILRSLRLMRIFKILRLRGFLVAGSYITKALFNSYRKILLFMLFISLLVTIIGSLMYIVEKDTPGFDSIPDAIYWAVVTITTVGYGDVSPVTPLGKFLSIIVMLCGYSIIAVPTGIVTSEMTRSRNIRNETENECIRCGQKSHLAGARYCNRCGERLKKEISPDDVISQSNN